MAWRPLFSSARERWETPARVYAELLAEFAFTLDPCPSRPEHEAGMPLFGTDGLSVSWTGQRVFCNPPYGNGVAQWLAKAREPAPAPFPSVVLVYDNLEVATDGHTLAAEAD